MQPNIHEVFGEHSVEQANVPSAWMYSSQKRLLSIYFNRHYPCVLFEPRREEPGPAFCLCENQRTNGPVNAHLIYILNKQN